jgi:hypothetical protein
MNRTAAWSLIAALSGACAHFGPRPEGESEAAAADEPADPDRPDLIDESFPYGYADEAGSKVAEPGEGGTLRLKGTTAATGEVFGGVGVVFKEPKGPVNASRHTGIAFNARRSAGSAAHVRFKIPDINTDPAGGRCKECFNDFGISFQVTEEWTRYEVTFDELAQEADWGDPRPAAIDPAHVYGLQWQVAVPGAELDIEIDDVQWMGDAPAGAQVAAAEPAAPESEAEASPGFDGIGIDPSRPRGDASLSASDDSEATEGYSFAFHGFLKIPMRVGFGSGKDFPDGVHKGVKLHSPPQIPDGAYTDWRYTNIAGGPWTELWLKYGNGKVTANVVLAAYDISDASYRDLLSQLGISQSFLTFHLPRLLGERGGVTWNVGAFSNRYGTAARYDAGKYDTYLFGATHVAGETVSGHYRLTDDLTVAVDHGVGAKLQVAPLTDVEAPFLPYPGDEQQGSTFLHHAHAGVAVGAWLTVAAHYLREWTDDARLTTEQDGHITNVGLDAKVLETKYGDGYLGWSHLTSKNPLRLAGAFEVLHSFEGWNLRDNYFGEEASGTGTIDTVLFQYTFSLATYLWPEGEFYGQDRDLQLSVFGMYNHIASDDALFVAPTGKLKVGAEAQYTPRRWLGLGLRYDAVQPDLDDDRYSFHVVSPSLTLHTAFASNEEIVIGYSHYLNGELVTPGYPHEMLAPDKHLFRLTAIMWW